MKKLAFAGVAGAALATSLGLASPANAENPACGMLADSVSTDYSHYTPEFTVRKLLGLATDQGYTQAQAEKMLINVVSQNCPNYLPLLRNSMG